MRKTHKDWPPELFQMVDKFTQKMWRYGFVTDYDEVFEQLAMAVLVLQHKLPRVSLDDLMGVTLMGEIFDQPYATRKEELKQLSQLYANHFAARKEKKSQEARRVARTHKEGHKGKPSAKKGKGKRA